jgi:hypothetical protein
MKIQMKTKITLCAVFLIALIALIALMWRFRPAPQPDDLKKPDDLKASSNKILAPSVPSWHGALPLTPLNAKFLDSHSKLLTTPIHSDLAAIGEGYNSATGDGGGKCVEFDPQQARSQLATASGSTAPKVIFELKQITSFEELKEALQVDTKISLGFGFFSSDASLKFMSTGSYSKYNNYVFVNVDVQNPSESLIRSSLTSSALDYARDGIDTFVSSCGDEYVYARRTGGQLTAMLRFSSSSDAEQKAISGSINASLGVFASGQANFAQTIDSLKTISNLTLQVIRNGGLGDLPNVDALKDAALKFPDRVSGPSGSPTLYALYSRPYSTVDNLPRNLRDFGFIRNQSQTLAVFAGWLDKAYQTRGNLKYIYENRSQFQVSPPTALDDAWKANEKIISDTLDIALHCHDQPRQKCAVPPPPTFIDISIFNRTGGASPSPTPQGQPEYGFQWVREHGGRRISQQFQVKQSRDQFQSQGAFYLGDLEGKIYQIDYNCSAPSYTDVCNRSRRMHELRSNAGDTEIINDGRGFNWYRRYDHDMSERGPDINWTETYTAYYELYERVCIRNCPAVR